MAKKSQKTSQEQKSLSLKRVNKDGSVEVVNYAPLSGENHQANSDSDVTDGSMEQSINFDNSAVNVKNIVVEDVVDSAVASKPQSGTSTRNRKRQALQAKNAAFKAENIRIGGQEKSGSNYLLFIVLVLSVLLVSIFVFVSDPETKAKIAELFVPIFGNVINKVLGKEDDH